MILTLTLTQREILLDAVDCCETCFVEEWADIFPDAPQLSPDQIEDLMSAAVFGGISLAQEIASLRWN